MNPVLSIRDRRAVVRYAIDRIDESLAQAWMREFCAANGILIHTLRDANNSPWAMEQRIQVATYLRSKRVKGKIIAQLMHRHYDMVRYYTRAGLREHKNYRRSKLWAIAANENKVNSQLTRPPACALY